MTVDQLVRATLLMRQLTDAKDWRETFEEHPDDEHALVSFEDIGMQSTPDADERAGYQGSIRIPRDVAIEMMIWLEARAIDELTVLGVAIQLSAK